MLERYGNSEEVLESSFTIWSCALLPGCLDDYESLLRIAERTVANHPENASVQRHQAAVQFRAGQVAAARDAFMQLSDETPEASSPAYAWLFLAMVEKQQGDDEAAKTWYQRADSHIMEQRKRAQSGKLDIPWN